MKNIYLRKTNIKTTTTRQAYLTSVSKQEHLITYTDLDILSEFKTINKELVIELPNEIMDHKSLNDSEYWAGLNERYINNFKHHTGYEHVAGSIHLNATGTNLHMHLSYVDRKLEKKPRVAKRDMYVYTSTGTRLKKNEYEESNPNHLKVAKGDTLLDFDKVSNEQKLEWKEFMLGDNNSKAKFELRREIRATLTDNSLKYSKCLESGLDIWYQKKMLSEYKELFRGLNNIVLQEFGEQTKYVKQERMQENGFIPYKKVGKILNNTPNEIQETIIEHNKVVNEYNMALKNKVIQNEELKHEDKRELIKQLKEDNKYTGTKNNTQKQNFVGKTEHIRVLLNTLMVKVENKIEGVYDWARELTRIGKREDRGNESMATGVGREGSNSRTRRESIGEQLSNLNFEIGGTEASSSGFEKTRSELEQKETNRDREFYNRTHGREEESTKRNKKVKRSTFEFEF